MKERARTSSLSSVGALGLLLGVGLFLVPAPALAAHVFSTSFGAAGLGAGQVSLAEHSGLAVDDTTHDVYVTDFVGASA